ncbi:MAG: transcriptional regulator PpsR [Panacagrimonas sp.]
MSKRTGPLADLSALSGLAPELAEMLVSVACDIALVLDEGGVIRSVAHGGSEPVAPAADAWVGRRWTDTVTGDTRQKAEDFLDDLANTGKSRLRHLNHSSSAGLDIPIAYTAVRLGEQGPTLAVGRDMRVVTAMQQRLVQAQQDMERDYWQRRQAETRYRLLFQVAAEPVLILDASTFDVLDANRAAAILFGRSVEQLSGKSVMASLDADAHTALKAVLDSARNAARVVEGETRLAHGLGTITVSVTPFQTDAASVLLMRARPVGSPAPEAAHPETHADALFAGLVKRTPDAVVISDVDGRVVLANAAFRELVQFPVGQSITGRTLADWVGDQDTTVKDILALVRSEGCLRLLSTRLRREPEQTIDIELSAALITDHDAVGFVMRASHHNDARNSNQDGNPDRAFH